jgi:hypothetical protein
VTERNSATTKGKPLLWQKLVQVAAMVFIFLGIVIVVLLINTKPAYLRYDMPFQIIMISLMVSMLLTLLLYSPYLSPNLIQAKFASSWKLRVFWWLLLPFPFFVISVMYQRMMQPPPELPDASNFFGMPTPLYLAWIAGFVIYRYTFTGIDARRQPSNGAPHAS